MAVVVSQGQNEIEEMRNEGPRHRAAPAAVVKENLDEKFKDPESNLRLVFVCAMWITGFDVPTLLDDLSRQADANHTLMQTIARANRVAPGKENGLIVDYVGIFRDLQNALAIYARPAPGGGTGEPILDKSALVGALRESMRGSTGVLRAARRQP